MNKLFNSPFDAGLRCLLLLSCISPNAATIDRISAYDFITIYSKDFDISHNNLHGDSTFNFSELASKRASCNDGIKEFILAGLVSINRTKKVFTYNINHRGRKYVESLSSDYATQYYSIAKKVHTKFSGVSDEEILNFINKKAIKALRRNA